MIRRIIPLFCVIVIVSFCAFSISCNNSETNKKVDERREVISFTPDTTINKTLMLNDNKSLNEFYSESTKKLELVEFIRESPVVVFCNNSQSEYLLAYQYEGGVKNSFSLFEIGYTGEIKCENTQTSYDYFYTESGLKLGLSKEELIDIKGNEYKEEDNVIIYSISDFANSNFLKHYNMPLYYLKCVFENNKIVKITFGFDYP